MIQHHPSPFTLTWIPSRLFEHLPEQFITPELAAAKQTEVRHIVGNRFADKHAKKHALQATSVHPQDEKWLKDSIVHRQDWLTCLNMDIAAFQLSDMSSRQDARIEEEAMSEDVFALFPRWEWTAEASQFPWIPQKDFAAVDIPTTWTDRLLDWKS